MTAKKLKCLGDDDDDDDNVGTLHVHTNHLCRRYTRDWTITRYGRYSEVFMRYEGCKMQDPTHRLIDCLGYHKTENSNLISNKVWA